MVARPCRPKGPANKAGRHLLLSHPASILRHERVPARPGSAIEQTRMAADATPTPAVRCDRWGGRNFGAFRTSPTPMRKVYLPSRPALCGFPGLGAVPVGVDNAAMWPAIKFRRLFGDGVACWPGWKSVLHTVSSPVRCHASPAHQVLVIADGILRLPTLVPTVHKRKTVPAGTVGKLQPNGDSDNDASDRTSGAGLWRRFSRSTTKTLRKTFKGAPVQEKLVEAGGPLLIVELANTPTDGLPPAFTQIDPASVGNAWLAFGWVSLGSEATLATWLLAPGTATGQDLRVSGSA